jgi:hypothetical protein
LIEWLQWARGRFRLEEVYLFGSFARGDVHEGSDIDLVLVGAFCGKMPYRIIEVLQSTDLPIEPWCYTPDEWRRMLADGHPFARTVLETGCRVFPEGPAADGAAFRVRGERACGSGTPSISEEPPARGLDGSLPCCG